MNVTENTKIDDLFEEGRISVRTHNIMVRNSIYTIGELMQKHPRKGDLLSLPGLGKKSELELECILDEIEVPNIHKTVEFRDLSPKASECVHFGFFQQCNDKLLPRTRMVMQRLRIGIEDILEYRYLPKEELIKHGRGLQNISYNTLDELYDFKESFVAFYDRIANADESAIDVCVLSATFSFLEYEAIDFCLKFSARNGHLPMLYIFFECLRSLESTFGRAIRYYIMNYGILTGESMTIDQIAEETGLTKVYINNSLAASKDNEQIELIAIHKDWSYYDGFLSKGVLTPDSQIISDILEKELPGVSAERFIRACDLLPMFKAVSVCKTVVLQNRSCSIDIEKANKYFNVSVKNKDTVKIKICTVFNCTTDDDLLEALDVARIMASSYDNVTVSEGQYLMLKRDKVGQ